MATANKTFNTRITHKIDIEANWMQAKNFTPLLGELIIYRAEKDGDAYPKNDENQDIRNYYITYPRIKIGDGKTNVNDLPFITDAIDDVMEALELAIDGKADAEHTHTMESIEGLEAVTSEEISALFL